MTSGTWNTVTVRTGVGGNYPVRVGTGALDSLPDLLRERVEASAFALISDERVAGILGDRVRSLIERTGRRVTVHAFPPGEASKNRGEWARLTDSLLRAGLGRDGCVVALGGGVTGDLAGFVAATFMRGLPVVQIPTSLVAMIDSSVGGKTGVDLPDGKNLVGAFHPPAFVIADPDLALTLPRGERAQGLVEAVKHGAILDGDYFEVLLDDAPRLLEGDPGTTERAVLRSIELKADVVSRDEKEGGLRQVLNFGHTLGHAIESLSGYGLPHGSAVARGMILEARLGEGLGVTRSGTHHRLSEAIARLGLDGGHPALAPNEIEGVLEHASRDKKVRRGVARYVLLKEIGEVSPEDGWSRPVPDAAVKSLLADPPAGAV